MPEPKKQSVVLLRQTKIAGKYRMPGEVVEVDMLLANEMVSYGKASFDLKAKPEVKAKAEK